MRTMLILLLATWTISPLAQTIEDCIPIKVDKARLACFDKSAKAAVTAKAMAEEKRKLDGANEVVRLSDPALLKSENRLAAESALKQLNKLTAATEVGISLRDYSTRIVDASGDFKDALRNLPMSTLRNELEAALADHVTARGLWSAMIQINYASIFQEHYCPMLTKDYGMQSCVIKPSYTPIGRTSSRESISDGSKNEVLSVVWSTARKRLARADALIASNRLEPLSTQPDATK